MAKIVYSSINEIPEVALHHATPTEHGYEVDAKLVLDNAVSEAKQPYEKDREIFLTKLADAELTEAVVAANGIPQLLVPRLRQSIRPEFHDDRIVIRVVDSNGEVRRAKSGEPLQVADLIAEAKANPEIARAAFNDRNDRRVAARDFTPPNRQYYEQPGVIRLTREQAKNPTIYRQALAKAGGHERLIVDKE
ncbi:MAG: hypothetical protein ACR2IF_04365 [Terriglobales bacterium]